MEISIFSKLNENIHLETKRSFCRMPNFTPEKVKLFELLEKINDGRIQLPNFQRDYKWKSSQIKKLIDSIQASYPAGSLLFLEANNKEELEYRPFEYISEKELKFPELLVLDGQQRLTSCYCAFYNLDLKYEKSFFLDYGELYNQYLNNKNVEISFEDCLREAKHGSLNPNQLLEKKWLNISCLKSKQEFRKERSNLVKSINDEQLKSFLQDEIENYLDSIFDYVFPVIRLSKEMPIEAVCKIFETINTTGLKLSAFDICVAKFMRQSLNLREKMNAIVRNDAALNNIFDKDETLFLQAIALLANKPPKANALPKNLEKYDIEKWWDKAVNGFKTTVELLDGMGIGLKKNTDLLPYKPILPLFAAVIIECNYEKLLQGEKSQFVKKLKKFVFTSAFSAHYTEGTDAKIQKEFPKLCNWINKDEEPEVIKMGVSWDLAKVLKLTKSGATGKAILCLINSNHPKDFYEEVHVGNYLNAAPSQLHHIFPKGQYKKDELESVLNFTYITDKSNNFIKDAKTKDYIKDILNRGTTESGFKDLLKDHLIDEYGYECLKKEDFDNFIISRAKIVKQKLEALGITVKDSDNDEFLYDE